jgi:hypothetical protein
MTFKVYVTDYDYSGISIERDILEPVGAEVVGLQDRTGKNLGVLAQDADALLQQYATSSPRTWPMPRKKPSPKVAAQRPKTSKPCCLETSPSTPSLPDHRRNHAKHH